MIYGYARCSTNEKLQDINRQVRELKQQGANDDTIYLEYESGTKENRAELCKLMNIIHQVIQSLQQRSAESQEAQNNYAILLNLQRIEKSSWYSVALLLIVQVTLTL